MVERTPEPRQHLKHFARSLNQSLQEIVTYLGEVRREKVGRVDLQRGEDKCAYEDMLRQLEARIVKHEVQQKTLFTPTRQTASPTTTTRSHG